MDTLSPLRLTLSMKQQAIAPTTLLYAEDPEQSYTTEMLEQQALGPFVPWSIGKIVAQEYHYWTILKVQNTESYTAEWWVQIPGNYTTATIKHEDGTTARFQGGNLMPLAERSGRNPSRFYSYAPVKLAANETARVFFQVNISRFYPLGGTKFMIGTPLSFENAQFKRESEFSFLNGLYSATLFLFCCYCMAYLIYTGEIFALWAILYAISLLVFFLHFNGFWYRQGFAPVFTLQAGMVFVNLSMFFELLFARKFLQLKTTLPRWNRFYLFALGYMGLASAIHAAYYFFSQDYINTVYASFYIHVALYLPHVLLALNLLYNNYRGRSNNDSALTIYSLGMIGMYTIMSYSEIVNGALSTVTLRYIQVGVIVYIIGIMISLSLRAGKVKQEKLVTEVAKLRQDLELKDLQELEQLKSRFFANVSHELRTPLALMLGPIRRLLRAAPEAVERHQLLGFLEKNTLHLQRLINEILDLSKLEHNKMELREEPTKIHSYLEQHLKDYYAQVSSHTLNIQQDLQLSEELNVMLDQLKFEKILNNYLSNAIKFTPAGGNITVRVATEDGQLVVTIQDSGRGIPAEDLPHVFDRFYQSKDPKLSMEGGTGIGLSMVKELATLMGGRVSVQSEWGAGSTFYCWLPLKLVTKLLPEEVLSKQKQPEYHQEVALRKADGSAHRILVVEDNTDLQAYYRIILKGYDCTAVAHGQEGIDYLRKNALPDLIISDLMMPVMDGIEFLGRLKNADHWRHIPIIMLTAKTNQQIKLKALRYGIDDYVNKPFDDDELLIRIENLLRHQAKRITYARPHEAEIVLAPERPKFTQADMEWLERLEQYILSHIEAAELSVAGIAREFAVSESTLLRQLKKLTGLTPNKYLRELRLNQAREHLQNRKFNTVAEVAFGVGFRDAAAFTRSFKKRFGKSPSEIG